MLGHLGAILGPCWAHVGPSWGHLGPMLGRLGPSWSHVGPSWGHVGPMLGHLGAILGLCWAVLGHLGAMLGLCWAILGPAWAYVGPMLAPFMLKTSSETIFYDFFRPGKQKLWKNPHFLTLPRCNSAPPRATKPCKKRCFLNTTRRIHCKLQR